jgi:hypothetical protein
MRRRLYPDDACVHTVLSLADESTGLAVRRTGSITCELHHGWAVRQAGLEPLKQSHAH